MAAESRPSRLIVGPFALLVVALGLACPAFALRPVTLEQAAARVEPDQRPALEGETIIVQGVVTTRALPVLRTSVLTIQDDQGHGLLLQANPGHLDNLQPGDFVEVQGTLANDSGAATLRPSQVRKLSTRPVLAPREVSVRGLHSPASLGLWVSVQARVIGLGENAGGDTIQIGDPQHQVKIWLPHATGRRLQPERDINVGDLIRVVGMSTQYCPTPPYTRGYEVMVADPAAITVVERGWVIPPNALLLGLTSVSLLVVIWWIRERRANAQRRSLKSLNVLAEEILASATPAEVVQRLDNTLPRLCGLTDVSLYLLRGAGQYLERVAPGEKGDGHRVPLHAAQGALDNALVLCFRNRTLIHTPDTRTSPIFRLGKQQLHPRAVLFVPMFAQSELLGVLVLEHRTQPRRSKPEEQTAMQHLGNQIAIALKLQEQQAIREQLFRSEKLAATGRLISGIASELQSPLESVSRTATRLLAEAGIAPGRELRFLSQEARRASDIVARLVAFTNGERTEPTRLDLNALVTSLSTFRSSEWRSRGIAVEQRLSPEPVLVQAVSGQIEQVLLNLLVHAEQSLAQSPDKRITLGTSLFAKRAIATISYTGWSAETTAADLFTDDNGHSSGAVGLGVCQGIVQSQGGEIRLIHDGPQVSRFEIELPAATAPSGRGAADAEMGTAVRTLTVLVVEPEAEAQRHLTLLLSARGHRVVPVTAAEDALELADRLAFDLVFCGTRLDGQSWVELLPRIRPYVGGFVLLSDGVDPELARVVAASDGHVLTKPVDAASLTALLEEVEPRLEPVPLARP